MQGIDLLVIRTKFGGRSNNDNDELEGIDESEMRELRQKLYKDEANLLFRMIREVIRAAPSFSSFPSDSSSSDGFVLISVS